MFNMHIFDTHGKFGGRLCDSMIYIDFLCNVCTAEAALDCSLNTHQFNPNLVSLNTWKGQNAFYLFHANITF